MATRSVTENIKKARRAFFHYGSIGAFQGCLNPLSTRSIIELCVMPVLLFGCENWILSKHSLDQLESFLGELAKRALRWPRHFSNTAAVSALEMESMRCRLVVRKLGFLRRQQADSTIGVGATAMRSLTDEPETLCLVKECRELENVFKTNYTDQILAGLDGVNLREVKEVFKRVDKERCLERCSEKAPVIAEVAKRGGSWSRLWDTTLFLGTRHTAGLQALSRLLAHHGHGSKPCPLCEERSLCTSPIIHFLKEHQKEIGLDCDSFDSIDKLLTQLVECDIQFVYKFWKLKDPF